MDLPQGVWVWNQAASMDSAIQTAWLCLTTENEEITWNNHAQEKISWSSDASEVPLWASLWAASLNQNVCKFGTIILVSKPSRKIQSSEFRGNRAGPTPLFYLCDSSVQFVSDVSAVAIEWNTVPSPLVWDPRSACATVSIDLDNQFLCTMEEWRDTASDSELCQIRQGPTHGLGHLCHLEVYKMYI